MSGPDLARLVKPGQIERAIWSAMMWAAENNPGFNGVPEYTDGGNSFAEVECRAAAARVLAAIDVEALAGLVEALVEIASFGDQYANETLAECGSYSAFGEPCSVQVARAALARLGVEA